MLFQPTTFLMPHLDAQEHDRLMSGRPASRFEIVARALRERRDNEPFFAPDEEILPFRGQRRDVTPLHTAARVRQAIGRALIAAGQRLDSEAA